MADASQVQETESRGQLVQDLKDFRLREESDPRFLLSLQLLLPQLDLELEITVPCNLIDIADILIFVLKYEINSLNIWMFQTSDDSEFVYCHLLLNASRRRKALLQYLILPVLLIFHNDGFSLPTFTYLLHEGQLRDAPLFHLDINIIFSCWREEVRVIFSSDDHVLS